MVHTEHACPDERTRLSRKLSAADLQQLPHDGVEYELVEGVLYMSTRPGLVHQRTIMRLALSIGPAVLASGGEIVSEPGLVFDDDGDSNVAPDVIVLLQHEVPAQDIDRLRTCPSIVAEVVSPGDEAHERDYERKRGLYLRKGAQEYWIIDRHRGQVLRLVRDGDVWQEHVLRGDDRLCTPLVLRWQGITVRELFA